MVSEKLAAAICAKVWSVVLTVIAAAARCSSMPRCARWRAISTGAPSCPAGIKRALQLRNDLLRKEILQVEERALSDE
jgi:hypothetical protein